MRTSSTLLAVALTGTLALSAAPANAETVRDHVKCSTVGAGSGKVNYSYDFNKDNYSTTIYYHSHCNKTVYFYVKMRDNDAQLGEKCFPIWFSERKSHRKYNGWPRQATIRLGKACPA